MSAEKKTIIFTDLDGTLLDHRTYSHNEAAPALKFIKNFSIPLIAVSSKTRAEIEHLIQSIPSSGIFVTENGSGIFFPEDYPLEIQPPHENRDGYNMITTGLPYTEVIERLDRARKKITSPLRGFFDMNTAEISSLTGLSPDDALRASRREFSEPFIYKGYDHDAMQRALKAEGLECTKGGRFWHALGKTDKGKAVRLIIETFTRSFPSVSWTSIGLGDSSNDISMLEAVDRPVAVARPDGTHLQPTVSIAPSIVMTENIGPAGWNEAVLELCSEIRNRR